MLLRPVVLAVQVLSLAGVAGASLLEPAIGTTFAALNFNLVGAWRPSDMGMAVGPNHIVQIVNGSYGVFSRSGATLATLDTNTFWQNAGIANPANPGEIVFDPRVVYDPVSQRFFATGDTFGNGTSNQVYLAVSNTSNPLDGWQAVGFTADTGFASGLADFPTLGFDQNGVYIGTDNFDNATSAQSISVFSIPKADLLLPAPSLSRMTSFTGLSNAAYGLVPHAAADPFGANGALVTIGGNLGEAGLAFLSGTGGAGASLSAPTILTGLIDGATLPPVQFGGSTVTSALDNRFGATPVVVGNLLYAANGISDGITRDILHWTIMDLTTRLVVQEGTLSETNVDYTYPSIAADDDGNFLIGFNRSSANDFMSAYAVGCHFDVANAACGTPIGLANGLGVSNDDRWGDYSATVIDPMDPNAYWTAIEITAADGTWTTQITQVVATPEPGTMGLLGVGVAGMMWWRRRRKLTPRQ